jgi:hydroxylaminobenzene mutase
VYKIAEVARMTRNERMLCVAGLALFLLALLQGFFIPLFVRVDAARAAHATALGSGTFLIAVGVLWPKLTFAPRPSSVWSALLAASLYLIAVGLTVGATYPAGSERDHAFSAGASMLLNATGGIVLVAAMIAVLLACRPRATELKR